MRSRRWSRTVQPSGWISGWLVNYPIVHALRFSAGSSQVSSLRGAAASRPATRSRSATRSPSPYPQPRLTRSSRSRFRWTSCTRMPICLVINKPAGMVVHPAAGNWHGTLVNAVLYHCPDLEGVGGAHRPGIVHRLDKDTSGVILVAKNDAAHRALQAQFQARTVHKTYWALVYGLLSPAQGEIVAPIGRDPRDRKRMAVVQSGGRPAATRYETLDSYRIPTTGERLSLAGLPSAHRPHPPDSRPPGVRQAPHRRR